MAVTCVILDYVPQIQLDIDAQARESLGWEGEGRGAEGEGQTSPGLQTDVELPAWSLLHLRLSFFKGREETLNPLGGQETPLATAESPTLAMAPTLP